APDRRIWRVTYRGEPVRGLPEPGVGVDAARDALRRALERIEAFAAAEDCRPFTERFREALAALSHPEARHGYHRDLWVEGHLPVSAAGLLDAAQSASVFGGMGSWNDLAFEGDAAQAEYR